MRDRDPAVSPEVEVTKMPAGRPTVYNKDILKTARGYLTSFKDMGDPVPTIAGLACVINVTRETCYDWARDPNKAEFSDILKELAQRQERELVAHGLVGNFNAPITKMMLTKHGYSDATKQEISGPDGGAIAITSLDLKNLTDAELESMNRLMSKAQGQAQGQ